MCQIKCLVIIFPSITAVSDLVNVEVAVRANCYCSMRKNEEPHTLQVTVLGCPGCNHALSMHNYSLFIVFCASMELLHLGLVAYLLDHVNQIYILGFRQGPPQIK